MVGCIRAGRRGQTHAHARHLAAAKRAVRQHLGVAVDPDRAALQARRQGRGGLHIAPDRAAQAHAAGVGERHGFIDRAVAMTGSTGAELFRHQARAIAQARDDGGA